MALTRVNTQVLDTGSVIQFARNEWTTETALSSPNGTFYDINASAIVFTPKRASSKILVMTDVSLEFTASSGTYVGGTFRLVRDGTAIQTPGQTHEHYVGSSVSNFDQYLRSAKSWYVTSNSTAATTFKLQLTGYNTGTTSAYCNRNAYFMSAINIFEIAQ